MSSDDGVVQGLAPTGVRVMAALLGVSGALAANPASAHFSLQAPPAWAVQDASGNPQKSAPCGQADRADPPEPTGTVTAFAPGATVTITINETIFHPGHYRVALAKDRSELPADPPVTAADTPCGSTVIEANPAFPLLADGQLVHTARFTGAQTFQVKLPSDITCDKCTLQIVEFMSNHPLNNPGGCFYHHCADISIGASGGGSSGTGGASTGGSAGKSGGGTTNGGSGGTTTVGGTSAGGTTTLGGTSSGGATATSGGASAGGATAMGGATSSGAGGAAPSDEGCGCSVPGQRKTVPLGVGLFVLGTALGLRRRRRSAFGYNLVSSCRAAQVLTATYAVLRPETKPRRS